MFLHALFPHPFPSPPTPSSQITPDKLPAYAYPIYWFSPFSWTVRSLSDNEFDAPEYQTPIAGPGSPTEESVYTSTFALRTGFSWMIAGPLGE